MIYVGFKGELIDEFAVKDGSIYNERLGYIAENELRDIRDVEVRYGNWKDKVTPDNLVVIWTGKNGEVYKSYLGLGRMWLENPNKYPHNEPNRSMWIAETSFKIPEQKQ